MIEIARLPADDRRELFHNTAAKTGLHDAIVEKDFWVCLTLDYLFHRSPWKKAVTFKGGTSLSKGYHLISRFSEDIDPILDWRVLGYGVNELWEKRSNTKQDAFNKEENRKAEVFLAENFCPQVREGLSAELGRPANLYIDEEDKQTVIFAYPNLFTDEPIMISEFMPSAGAGSKPVAFGDFSYYWVIDRRPVSARPLVEKFALYSQIGYLALEFLDGKLIRSDAVKVLQMENGASA